MFHLHGQQFLLADVITANCSKLDLKNESTSSRFTISKNWSSESFLLHEGTLFGFRGAGGQSRILGILCSLDVGVRQHSLLSSTSSIFFRVSTLLLLLSSWLEGGVDVVRVLIVSSRVFDMSCKNSRSVDMVALWFLVLWMAGNWGERCWVFM